jgi:hypothetical protein
MFPKYRFSTGRQNTGKTKRTKHETGRLTNSQSWKYSMSSLPMDRAEYTLSKKKEYGIVCIGPKQMKKEDTLQMFGARKPWEDDGNKCFAFINFFL